jgi:hypothetical protein
MKHNKFFLLAASLLLGLISCKKDFLEEKRDLGGTNEEVYKDSTLSKAYVDYIYFLFQPGNNSQALSWNLATNSIAFAQTTEEFPGETNWNKVWANVSYLNAHALNYFGAPLSTSIANNTWTRMKQINLFLDNIDNYGLSQDVRTKLKGQMYFWRAWQYFDLVRLYGGVPLVLHSQNPITSNSNEDLKIQRSSSSETFNQIVKDLDSAIAMLPGKWASTEWGRITSGGAAALKGRVLLTWASPMFNRSDDRSRWQKAYDANLAAKTLLEANGFGLYKTGTLTNGTAFQNMFTKEVDNPEAVIVFGFNNRTPSTSGTNLAKNNGWEQAARPKDILGGGSLNATKQMVDAFPMKDGKMPGSSAYSYDAKKFYKDRDPRFYKTFAYNGALWPYNENKNYRLWTYRWFASASATTPASTTESVKGANSSGIYVRKGTDTSASNSSGSFSFSGTDFIELRFTEVLLNLAEAAIGSDKISEGVGYINQIRDRAGIENKDGNYGLGSITGRDQAFAAVINERKLEFAYEGKRFFDLRRWMLFNNDYGTCTRLGVQPIDGTRRTGLYIYVKTTPAGTTKYVGSNTQDPMYKPQNPAGNLIVEREPSSFPTGITNQDQYVDYLYDNYFVVTEKDDVDPTTTGWKFKWYNQYYFFGLNSSILNNAPYLEQTKDWDGLKGTGTFDPLK